MQICLSQHTEKGTVLRLLWYVYTITSWRPSMRKISRIGIWGAALGWFESYLKGRTQYVAIIIVQSSMTKLKCGVPHGSVLGQVLSTTYLLPLGDISRQFGVQFDCYADDTQLYIPFSQNYNSCYDPLEECISESQNWMKANFVKLNAEKKTEMMILCSPYFWQGTDSWHD